MNIILNAFKECNFRMSFRNVIMESNLNKILNVNLSDLIVFRLSINTPNL